MYSNPFLIDIALYLNKKYRNHLQKDETLLLRMRCTCHLCILDIGEDQVPSGTMTNIAQVLLPKV